MRRMLIVDDQLDICGCLEDYFSARGFAVVSAFSGEQALQTLEHQPPDVVLLDILLPGLSGLEVLKRIRQLCPTAKVIMVTALDQGELRAEARRCGACGYITKPFDFSEATWSAVFTDSPR
jgi:DNA-binding response OmpR family regulator